MKNPSPSPRVGSPARSLVLALGLLFLGAIGGRAQEVELPTSGSGGDETPSVPLWRLPVHVVVSVSGGYDENVTTTNEKEGSIFSAANLSLAYSFGTSRTRANLSTGTGVTYYPDVGGPQFDPDLNLALSVTHQVNLRLTVDLATSMHYRAEPDFTTDLSLDRKAGNYFSSQNSLSANYQWLPRFSTITAYSLGVVNYDNDSVATQNRVDQSFSQSLRFLYLPVTTFVADYAVSFATYESGERDSHTQTMALGIDHSFSARLHGGLRGGAEFHSNDNPLFQSSDGVSPYFSANLGYMAGGKTSLSWSAMYGTQESYLATAGTSLTFRTSLQASYALTPRISASVTGAYVHSENQEPEFVPGFSFSSTEDSVDLSLALSYSINRFVSANASYDHMEVQSDVGLRTYSRNRFSTGLSLNF